MTYETLLTRREFVLERARGQSWRFRDGFVLWLFENFPIWERFEREANAVYERGRRHYGARRIGEYLRHETALTETPEAEFKLNDHVWPDLARLYLMLYPERESFFELRESPKRRVA